MYQKMKKWLSWLLNLRNISILQHVEGMLAPDPTTPHPPSPVTVIARETCNDHNSDEELSNITAAFGATRKSFAMNTSENITLKELLEKSYVTLDMNVNAFKVCSRGSSVVMISIRMLD